MRRLEKNRSVSDFIYLLEELSSGFRLNRWKSEHGDRHGREPGGHEGGQRGARSGEDVDRYAAVDARLDELEPRIGNRRGSRIGHERDVVAAFETSEQLGDAGACVVLVETDGGRLYGVVSEQL